MNGRPSVPGSAGDTGGRTPLSAADHPPPIAWQPLTPRGVAAFARAPLGRLLLVQLLVALLAAATAVWFLHRCWYPTIGNAIRALPPQGALRAGALEWADPAPVCLADGRFLALIVDLDHAGQARSPAQVQVEFGRQEVKVYSLLGAARRAYPRDRTVPFNRTDLGPWWGAWAPALLGLAAVLMASGLLLSWACLATLYCLPAWLIGFFANRDCRLGGCWRLAGAALMPGALGLSAVILLYGSGALDLVQLAVGAAAHLVVGWLYLFFSALCLPRQRAAPAKTNPFA